MLQMNALCVRAQCNGQKWKNTIQGHFSLYSPYLMEWENDGILCDGATVKCVQSKIIGWWFMFNTRFASFNSDVIIECEPLNKHNLDRFSPFQTTIYKCSFYSFFLFVLSDDNFPLNNITSESLLFPNKEIQKSRFFFYCNGTQFSCHHCGKAILFELL